jgi:hypothetical protein
LYFPDNETLKYEITIEETMELNIGLTPALIIGEKSDFVHGLHGRKEEALAFAEVAVKR